MNEKMARAQCEKKPLEGTCGRKVVRINEGLQAIWINTAAVMVLVVR